MTHQVREFKMASSAGNNSKGGENEMLLFCRVNNFAVMCIHFKTLGLSSLGGSLMSFTGKFLPLD